MRCAARFLMSLLAGPGGRGVAEGGGRGEGGATSLNQAGKKAGDFVHFRPGPGRCKGPSEPPQLATWAGCG